MISNAFMQIPDKQPASNHAVIVLASGLSQRLGQPKQLLYKDGEPLIRYMTKLAVTTNPQGVFVVIPDDHPAITHAISDLAFQHPASQILVNKMPQTGMAHSLSLGIAAIMDTSSAIDRVLIMGIDQILLDEHHLVKLLAGKTSVVASGYHNWQNADAAGVSDILKKDIIGLPLVIDNELLKKWQPALIGDKGLRHLIRSLPPSQINTVTNAQLSYDIDTPAQLAYAQQKGWLDKQPYLYQSSINS